MLKQTKILTRLIAGFSVILAATLFLGIMGARSIVHLQDMTANIFKHPFTVTTQIRDTQARLATAQKILADIAHHASPAEVDRLEQRLLDLRAENERNLPVLRERYQGDKSDIEQIVAALVEWRRVRDETINLVRQGRRQEAIALNSGRGAQLGETVLNKVRIVADFSAGEAARFMQAAEQEADEAVRMISVTIILLMATGIAVTWLITRSVRRSLRYAVVEVERVIEASGEKARQAEAIGAGELSLDIAGSQPLKVDLHRLPDDEMGALIKAAVHLSEVQCTLDEAFRKMTASLRHGRDVERASDWLKSGLNELAALMRGEQGPAEMADKVLRYLAEHLQAGVGALYLFDERGGELKLLAGYALPRHSAAAAILLREGVIGQAARDRKPIFLDPVPADYLPIKSALGDAGPRLVAAVPLVHNDRLVGALELGSFREFSDVEREFLEHAQEGIAIGLSVNLSRQRLADLLEETQQQAEELRVQQEELQQSNEELEERAEMMEAQREDIRAKNAALEAASENLRQKAEELERVSTYKSQFLANMSHELRTPLNSVLILSSLLTQNKEGNLTDKQVEFASTIHGAGTDLLDLINDILDLSKVEAGQMQFQTADIPLPELCDSIRNLFVPQAEQKRLAFQVVLEADVPRTCQADQQRVEQVLKNLLSNALKFTEEGQVALRVAVPASADNPLPAPAIAFAVSDTGIGISPANQQTIFQAFQQADGSISRKYGGTGLGLSISIQLARKMGGDIRVQSTEGQGSVFTLYLPIVAAGPATEGVPAVAAPALRTPQPPPPSRSPAAEDEAPPAFVAPVPDDREHLKPGDRSILVVDDDLNFIRTLQGLIRERGFAVLAAADGESGLALAERYLPSAIILDVMLPHIDGWGVMRRLKDNPRTRHIPVHFVTCLEDRQKAMAMAAIGFVTKPVDTERMNEVFQAIESSVTKAVRKLLIVEDNQDEAYSMVALLDDRDVDITVAETGKAAIALLSAQSFDCVVLDLGLADMSGFELLHHVQSIAPARQIPIIIHSGRELTHDDERQLRRFAESIIIKGAKSPERLLNEVSLFLHLVESKLHPDKQRMIRTAIDKEAMLEGRKVLLVDDDMRNLFSVSSLLGEKNMTVIEAENGREALARLAANPDVDIVLMDIMMPDTDGYTAMREIRKDPRHAALPVIAMTAKAMRGDYEKCIAAGASDYIAKPIEVDKLMSLIRVWLYQRA